MTILRGYAVGLECEDGAVADHTYVGSAEGFKWRCWRKGKDGHLIVEATGDIRQAKCMAEDFKGHAGILYGLTGVCHQSANRILYSSRITVHMAKGYAASHLLFGTYGIHDLTGVSNWEYKKIKCMPGLLKTEVMVGGEDYFEQVNQLYRFYKVNFHDLNQNHEFVQKGELEALMRVKLKGAMDQYRMEQLHGIREKLLERKQHLSGQLLSKALTPKSFSRQVNEALNDCLVAMASIITDQEYLDLFQVAPGITIKVVDEVIMMKQFEKFHKDESL